MDYERKILTATREDLEQLRDELSTTAFQWAKADRERRIEDANRLMDRIDDLKGRIADRRGHDEAQ